MKKVFIKIFVILLLFMGVYNVGAANYELNELIPIKIKTSITTDIFSYRSFSYEDGVIYFDTVKNLSNEERPFTISIGLFNKKERNIGTINYCSSEKLASKEERSYQINVTNDYLGDEYSNKDIAYIVVFSDNKNCTTDNKDMFLGETLKEVLVGKNNTLDSKTEFLLQILTVIGVILVLLFLYKFLFTNAFQNMDGDDIRTGYKKYNKELQLKREYEARVNPPKPKEKVKTKTDKVLYQEEQAKNEDKSGTDLHNMYK